MTIWINNGLVIGLQLQYKITRTKSGNFEMEEQEVHFKHIILHYLRKG